MTQSSSANNERLSKRMSIFYVAARAIPLCVATLIWAVVPILFCDAPEIPGTAWALVLAIFYIVILWLFCSIFGCFTIGQARIRELFAWYCLALFFADLLLWVTKLIVIEPVTGVLFQLGVWAVQSLVGIPIMVMLTRAYFKIYPVRHVCAIISGTDYEKSALAKIAMLTERFSIDMVLNQTDIDADALAALAPGCNTIFVGNVRHALRQAIIEDCYERGRMTVFLPTAADAIYSGVKATQVSDTLLFTNSNIGLAPEQRFFKRCVDIVGALVGIIISAIPMAICAIIIKATDGGTVFYRQKRLTRDGEVFEALKLRSMRMDAEKDGARLATGDDDRIDSHIIETNAKRPLSALAFASVFPPKTTGLPAAFPQVDVQISNLRNLLEKSSRNFLANVDANPSLSKKLAICPFVQIAGSGRLGSSCAATALQAV